MFCAFLGPAADIFLGTDVLALLSLFLPTLPLLTPALVVCTLVFGSVLSKARAGLNLCGPGLGQPRYLYRVLARRGLCRARQTLPGFGDVC